MTEIDDPTAIREVLLRYARAVDARDVSLVASCFTSDAAYRGALASGTITDALAALGDAMHRYEATRHAITAQEVDVDGDRARSHADCTAQHWLPDGSSRTVGVRYHDELARAPEGWRITRREVECLWTRGGGESDG